MLVFGLGLVLRRGAVANFIFFLLYALRPVAKSLFENPRYSVPSSTCMKVPDFPRFHSPFPMANVRVSEWRKLPVSLAELCIDTTLRCGQSFRWKKLKDDEW
jgi:hypothetical protein